MMVIKIILPSCTWVKDLNSIAIEKIENVLNEYDFKYELEIIDDLQKALEMNIINPPAILIDGQKVFEKKWPSEGQLRRIVELMIE